MESHPAHALLPPGAREDALDALTWSYTGQFTIMLGPRFRFAYPCSDCLLPSARPVPPPFSQEECQELIKLLQTLGEVAPPEVVQLLTHNQATLNSLSPRMWCTRVSCHASSCV